MSFLHRGRPLILLSIALILPFTMLSASRSRDAVAARGAHPRAFAGAPLVHLPADQAAHATAQNEWWYVVGHLHAGRQRFGYEMTIFKFVNVRPPGFSAAMSLFRTDVAITDEGKKHFYEQITPYFPQSVTVSSTHLSVRAATASLQASSLQTMDLSASLPAGSLKLSLSSRRSPMFVGGRGYIPFGNGFTYYYSLTDLATTGSLTLHHQRLAVSGISWLDHQWGDWSWSAVRGWRWMALQLNNGVQLSVFDFRSTTQRVRAASVLLAGNGGLRTAADATITDTGQWRSPHTGGIYPSGWIVRIPSLHARVRVVPTVRDQELVLPLMPRGSYWEGSTTVSGTWNGLPVRGSAYTELTGYSGR